MKKRRPNTKNFSVDRSNPNRNVYKVTTRQYAARDAPGHTLVKTRVEFQKNYDEVFNSGREAVPEDKKMLQIQELESQSEASSEEAWRAQPEVPAEPTLGKRAAPEPAEASEKEASDELPEEEEVDEDEEALLAEYERLKALEEETKRVKESESQSAHPGAPALRKKWTEDTLFQNQAVKDRATREQHTNDLLRSDKHRRLLKRYIQT